MCAGHARGTNAFTLLAPGNVSQLRAPRRVGMEWLLVPDGPPVHVAAAPRARTACPLGAVPCAASAAIRRAHAVFEPGACAVHPCYTAAVKLLGGTSPVERDAACTSTATKRRAHALLCDDHGSVFYWHCQKKKKERHCNTSDISSTPAAFRHELRLRRCVVYFLCRRNEFRDIIATAGWT